ncbi:MAG: hypothetical protein MUC96_05690 [Myxococcaceae bacterium]|jgi:hypothetical protein|nr:hypothetical protein [Myxococcaceae bacterium]
MLATALTLVLAAPNTEVVVLPSHPALAAATRAALGKRPLIDETEAWVWLFAPPGAMVGQDFEGFTAGPPSFWPAAMNAEWTAGVGHCRDMAGPPPWKATLAAAVSCGQRLAAFLWGRLLAHRNATKVLVVRGTVTDGLSRLGTERYSPGDETALRLQDEGPDAQALASKLVKAALAGQGTAAPRTVVTVFPPPAPPAGADLLASEAVVSDAVPGLASCENGPATLEVAPAKSVLAQSVAQRWARSVKGGAAALPCTLTLSEHEENAPPIGAMLVVTAVLRCGEVTVPAEAAKGTLVRASLAARLSETLVKGLAKRLCR